MIRGMTNVKLRFTKEKFLELPPAQQHKKCCEILKHAYETTLALDTPFLRHYNDLQRWLGLPELSHLATRKVIADRFHWHLHRSERGLREHHLLLNVPQSDRTEGQSPLPIAIYLDHIRSAHNVGSIIRTTEALRLGSLYFSEGMAFTDNKQVRDTAMSSEHWVDCAQDHALSDLPKPVICLETSPNAIDIHAFLFPPSFTLVIGNEEYGCSDYALQQADHLVKIPLYGRKNSLNVANAFAIAAAEIRRQHHLNTLSCENQW